MKGANDTWFCCLHSYMPSSLCGWCTFVWIMDQLRSTSICILEDDMCEVIIIWGYSSGWFDVCQSCRCGKAYYSSCSINQCCYCRWAMHHIFSYSRGKYSGELSQLSNYVARETYFSTFIWHTFIRTYFSPVYSSSMHEKNSL